MPYNQILAERVRKVVMDYPGYIEKKLFGGIGFLLNGNMACGVLGDDLIVRIGAENDAVALAKPFVRQFMGVPGRPMAGWVLVSPGGTASDKDLDDWVKLGTVLAASLPAKE